MSNNVPIRKPSISYQNINYNKGFYRRNSSKHVVEEGSLFEIRRLCKPLRLRRYSTTTIQTII